MQMWSFKNASSWFLYHEDHFPLFMSVQMGVSEISNSCKFKEEVMWQLLFYPFSNNTSNITMLFLVRVFTHPPVRLLTNRMLLEAVADCVNTHWTARRQRYIFNKNAFKLGRPWPVSFVTVTCLLDLVLHNEKVMTGVLSSYAVTCAPKKKTKW